MINQDFENKEYPIYNQDGHIVSYTTDCDFVTSLILHGYSIDELTEQGWSKNIIEIFKKLMYKMKGKIV